MDHRGNKKICGNKWQGKHDDPKPMGCSKLRRKFTAIQFYLKKQEKSQINNISLHQKQLEKEEQIKPKVNRRKEVIKVRAEINEIEMKKTTAKINET